MVAPTTTRSTLTRTDMTPEQREKTFDEIVRQAHAERARVVGELLATALVGATAALARLVAAAKAATVHTEPPPSHALRLRRQRAAEARRGLLLADVGR
jgi:hypothetical protein